MIKLKQFSLVKHTLNEIRFQTSASNNLLSNMWLCFSYVGHNVMLSIKISHMCTGLLWLEFYSVEGDMKRHQDTDKNITKLYKKICK